MAALNVKVPEALLDELKTVWNFNKSHIRPDILKRMGWTDLEAFVGDVLAHGYREASESPVEFMKQVRDVKDPIFLDPRKRGASKGAPKGASNRLGKSLQHEFERAYS